MHILTVAEIDNELAMRGREVDAITASLLELDKRHLEFAGGVLSYAVAERREVCLAEGRRHVYLLSAREQLL